MLSTNKKMEIPEKRVFHIVKSLKEINFRNVVEAVEGKINLERILSKEKHKGEKQEL